MSDIMFITVCGYICGLRDEEEIADFAEERREFFSKFMNYERLPCKATFSNIWKTIKPDELELCLHGILRNVLGGYRGKTAEKSQICVDGKVACGENSIHIVTALLADFRVSVGQVLVDDKSNEIPAVQELLDLINIENSVVSLDAMHCQKETMAKIIENKGDYVVQVKGNQEKFREDIEGIFRIKGVISESFRTIEKGHGRIETRVCQVLEDEAADEKYFSEWRGLKKIFAVKRKTESYKTGEISEEISYYISSCDANAEELLGYTRKHWQIESFHWILDKIMGEDGALLRDKNTQFCMNIVRKFAVSIVDNYIKNANPKKKTISGNMRKCLLNSAYLEDILNLFMRLVLLHFCCIH